MLRHVLLNDTGHIGCVSDSPVLDEDQTISFAFDFPEGFDFERQVDWKIIDGALEHDPAPEPAPVPTALDLLNTLLGVESDDE